MEAPYDVTVMKLSRWWTEAKALTRVGDDHFVL